MNCSFWYVHWDVISHEFHRIFGKQISLSYSQEPTTCSSHEPNKSSPRTPSKALGIHFNITFQFIPWFFMSPFFLGFPYTNFTCTSPVPHMCHMSFLSHSSWFDHWNNIWCKVHVMTCAIFSSPLITRFFHTQSIVFANTLRICTAPASIWEDKIYTQMEQTTILCF